MERSSFLLLGLVPLTAHRNQFILPRCRPSLALAAPVRTHSARPVFGNWINRHVLLEHIEKALHWHWLLPNHRRPKLSGAVRNDYVLLLQRGLALHPHARLVHRLLLLPVRL